ncbi:3'-5' exonuclease [Sphingomonas sp. BK069]|uniref:3'-5' exonuclease n=1 Tax=Sphingomonas sp. BK069 TaxID=2586979 RepID=UPI00161FB1CE|nr:3'-5' exonuclease [Sphingomonas sp. BK069]MBB3348401.1 DNA polymerase-3 subunit epsilon [Sphingomonas sp. BK069]
MANEAGVGRTSAAGEDVRVQFRLSMPDGATGEGDLSGNRTGVVVDVETTGVDGERGTIVELTLRRFRFDAAGRITYLDRTRTWREDPGFALPAQLTRRTGLRDEDVRGREIDGDEAMRLLRSGAVVIAHDAAHARPAVERRLPELEDLSWACSMTQIDWSGRAFDGRSLGYLLRQAGWFHEAHRGPADVNAVLRLLRHDMGGRTALAELLAAGCRPSWIVRAVGAPFEAKERLRGRGYRWNAGLRTWWTEIDEAGRDEEQAWLGASVYSSARKLHGASPQFEEIRPTTRFK